MAWASVRVRRWAGLGSAPSYGGYGQRPKTRFGCEEHPDRDYRYAYCFCDVR